MKITSFKSMYDLEPKHPRFNLNNLFNKHFLKLIFSKAFCRVKTDEMEVDCYLKLVGGEGGIQSYFKLVH